MSRKRERQPCVLKAVARAFGSYRRYSRSARWAIDVVENWFDLDGNTLTLCRATQTGDVQRPHEFKTTAEGGLLIVRKRATK